MRESGGRDKRFAGGRSILHAANLSELAYDTAEQFIRIASYSAKAMSRLRDLRLGMRERLLASSLMDHRGFAAKLESAYRRMWRSAAAESLAF